jgi:hypothetical protein
MSAGISTIGVGKASATGVSVGERVSVGGIGVEVEAGVGVRVVVGGREVAEAGTAVDEGRGVNVDEAGVDVIAKAWFDCVVPAGFIPSHSHKKSNNKMIATINLKRS